MPLPALLGGAPVRPQGPPDWPSPDEDIRRALEGAYRDGSWGRYHGGNVERLEQRLAGYHGVGFALTCGSGTFAVELALRALKVKPGDEVILAGYDYPGNFLCVHAIGATPVLVDVAPDNWNLAAHLLAATIGPKTRAVIASHLHGGMVPMRALMDLAAAHGLRVLEDAAQAPGATLEGRKAGTWGDAGILSFGGSKLLTAGRGGALLTPHADVAQRARTQLHRGNHICPLSELQAAVLMPQLDRLDERNARRAGNVQLLQARLRVLPGIQPFVNPSVDSAPSYYKLGMQYDAARFGLARDRLIAAARAEGIALDEGFQALHVGRSPSRLRRAGPLKEAERAHQGALLLHHPVLLGTPVEIEQVAAALKKIHAHAGVLNAAPDKPYGMSREFG
jgi:dTDP-4-amino-4,6-dideoxygalactose transaminase